MIFHSNSRKTVCTKFAGSSDPGAVLLSSPFRGVVHHLIGTPSYWYISHWGAYPQKNTDGQTLGVCDLSAPHGNSGLLVSRNFHAGYAHRRITSYIYQLTCPPCSTVPHSRRPQMGSTTQVRSSMTLSSVRFYLFIHTNNAFISFLLPCSLLSRVAGWVGLMSAPAGALRKSGQSLDDKVREVVH